MLQKLLVGTDGSDSAQNAVEKAAGLAKAAKAELIICHGYEEPQQAAAPFGDKTDYYPAAEVGKAILEDAEKRHGKGVTVKTVLRGGDPSDALLDVAEEEGVDLIIVGNRGMTGAKRFFLGAVPNRISHHAPCSVLIVHTT